MAAEMNWCPVCDTAYEATYDDCPYCFGDAESPIAGGQAGEVRHRPLPTKPAGTGTLGIVAGSLMRAAAWPILRPPLWAVCLVLYAVMAARITHGQYPGTDAELAIAESLPHAPPRLAASGYGYLMHSLAGPILGRLVGALTPSSFMVMHAFALLVGFSGLLLLLAKRRGGDAARLVMVTLACSSAPAVMLGWLGSYDAFTFLLTSALVVAASWPAVLAVSMALGLFHFEQGVFVALALLIVRYRPAGGRVRYALLTLGGLCLGKIVLTGHLVRVDALSNRFEALAHPGAPPSSLLLVYTLLGAALLLVGTVRLTFGRDWGEIKRAVWALLVLIVPTALASDQTRTYAMMAWPVLMTVALVVAERADEDGVTLYAGLGLVAFLLLPTGFVYSWNSTLSVDPQLGTARGALVYAVSAVAVFLLCLPKLRAWGKGRRQASSPDEFRT